MKSYWLHQQSTLSWTSPGGAPHPQLLMRSTAIGTAQLEHVEVEAEEGVHQACLLVLGEVLRQGGVEAAGEDRLQLVNQILLDDRRGAVGHPDEEERVVAAPVLLTIAKDPTRSPNNTFKLLGVPEE